MDIHEEMSLLISEADNDARNEAGTQWRSRVSHRNQHHQRYNHPDFKVGRGFQPKFPTLGDTKQLRVPWVVHSNVDHMLIEMERVSSIRGVDYVISIFDKIIEGLQAVDTH